MPGPVSPTAISTICAPSSRAVTRDAPIIPARAVERVHAVEDEVEQHLLQMHAVAPDVRQIARYVHVQLHLPRRRIDPHERRDVAHERAHVEPPRLERLPLEQPAHAIDDLARALVVLRMSARIARTSSRSGEACCRKSSAASALRRIVASG